MRGRIPTVEVISIKLGPADDEEDDFVARMHIKVGRYHFDGIEFFRDDDGTVLRCLPETVEPSLGPPRRTYPSDDDLLAFVWAAAWAIYKEDCRKQGREPEGDD